MSSIHLARHGQSLGSFSEEEVREGISSKRFVKDDLAWRIGMSDWVPLHEVADSWGFDVSLLGEVIMDHQVVPPDCFEPAWERRSTIGFFKALYLTVKMVLMAPNHTFSRLRTTGGLINPLFYYLIMASSTLTIRLAIELPLVLKNPSMLGPQLATLPQNTIMIGALGLVVISPVFFVFTMFFSSLVTHLSLKIVKSAHEPFEATFRAFCYSLGSVSIVQLIPIVGGIISLFWGLLSYFIGLKKVHEISALKTFFAIFISTILSSAMVMLIAGIVIIALGITL